MYTYLNVILSWNLMLSVSNTSRIAPYIKTLFLSPLFSSRVFKTELEKEVLRFAARISSDAHKEVQI